MTAAASDSQRLDKWLWQARFFKSRSLAAGVVSGGHLRVDGERVSKPARAIRPGVVLTFPQGRRVRVVRIVALGTRRGPASEAQTLYEDLSPPPPERDLSAPQAEKGGRPRKRDLRRMPGALE